MSRHPFKWPSDLYVEFRFMHQAEFLANTLNRLLQVARSNDVVEGLAVDPSTLQLFQRTMTAEQILRVIQDNEDLVDGAADLIRQLQALIDVAPGAQSLVAWDDESKNCGITYAITKDGNGKRITLVLLGNEKDARLSGGLGQFESLQEITLPKHDHAKTEQEKNMETVALHKGLHRYLMDVPHEQPATAAEAHKRELLLRQSHKSPSSVSDDQSKEGVEAATTTKPEMSKLAEIVAALKPVLAAYPKYKLYVTGVGRVGAGLAQLVAFFLASDDATVPKPVSCLTFGAPRVGNYGYLQAVQALEQQRFLRASRLVQAHDGTAHLPVSGYCHVGFQVKLLDAAAASDTEAGKKDGTDTAAASPTASVLEVTYPKLVDTCWNRLERAWNNRVLWSEAAVYQYGDGQDLLQQVQEPLQELDLNELYSDEAYTGYTIAPLPVEK